MPIRAEPNALPAQPWGGKPCGPALPLFTCVAARTAGRLALQR